MVLTHWQQQKKIGVERRIVTMVIEPSMIDRFDVRLDNDRLIKIDLLVEDAHNLPFMKIVFDDVYLIAGSGKIPTFRRRYRNFTGL